MPRRNPLVILCYHGLTQYPEHHLHDFCFVTPEKFRNDLRCVRKLGWTLASLQEAIVALRRGDLRWPTVVITFDDGFKSVLSLAEPILRGQSAHATIYLPTHFILAQTPLWFTHVIHSIRSTKKSRFNFYGRSFELSDHFYKQDASRRIQNFLRELHPQAIDIVMAQLAQQLDVELSNSNQEHQLMSIDECKRALQSGVFALGAHSAHHYIHSKISQRELRDEISQSQSVIRELYQSAQGGVKTLSMPFHYAYPNGRRRDISESCFELLMQSGVESAVTTISGWNWDLRAPLSLKRYCVGPQTRIEEILS
jgi:peptidoglycan/xylan/chitin deacetylase (PgdA/CDA1 family)